MLCYVSCCNGAAFSWKSALAPILALSTSEAELISVASCTQEVNFQGPFQACAPPLVLRVRLHRHWRPTPRSDPDTRPARRFRNQGLSCSSAQVPAFSSSRWSLTRSSLHQGPGLHGGSPFSGLSGFSLTRRVWYSPPCLSPLLCILAYLT
jgi:hypothetical protein